MGDLLKEAAVMAAVCGGGLLALWWVKRNPDRFRQQPGAFPRHDGAVRAMGDLLAELKRTSDAMSASLDRRAADLKTLIAEADRRIALLDSPRPEAVPQAIPESRPAGEASPELKPVFEQVYALADAGKPVLDIARETQLNKGSVQLILGLRDMKRAADGSPAPGPSRG